MTKDEAERAFDREVRPTIEALYGKGSEAVTRAWNEYIGNLYGSGLIGRKEANQWRK